MTEQIAENGAEKIAEKIIVRDDGFHPQTAEADITLGSLTTPAELNALLHHDLIAIQFPAANDGRGFSLARRLRALGYRGRLRASGRLLADHYAMARRVGFDEVAPDADIIARQPQDQWLARADWRDWDHRSQLAG